MNHRLLLLLREQKISPYFHKHIIGFHKSAIFVLLGLVILQFIFIHVVVDAGEMTSYALLECTNKIRQEQVKNALVMNDILAIAAEKKLDDMQEYNYWAHQNPVTGKQPWNFVEEAGYNYETSGENLAIGFSDSQKICDAWGKSKLHYENIINPDYQEVGFAIDKANLHKNAKGILVVQMFGSRNDFQQGQTSQQTEQNKIAMPEDEGGPSLVLGEMSDEESDLHMNNLLFFVIFSSFGLIFLGVLCKKAFFKKM